MPRLIDMWESCESMGVSETFWRLLVLLTGIRGATAQGCGYALAIFRWNTEEEEKVRDMNSWNSL